MWGTFSLLLGGRGSLLECAFPSREVRARTFLLEAHVLELHSATKAVQLGEALESVGDEPGE